MSPKFNLEIANFLYCLLHFTIKSLKFYYISQFRIYMLMLLVILFYVLFDDVFVSKDSKLLLERGFLLYSNVEFNK